jgi:hypothetical protein
MIKAFSISLSFMAQTFLTLFITNGVKGLSINDGDRGQGFCDNSARALIITTSMTKVEGRGVKNCS